MDAWMKTLDEVETQTDANAMVVTSGHEKIFSNGLDLEWLGPVIQRNDIPVAKDFFYQLNEFLKKTLTFPLLTVAAISGHAFAGGAIWACAFDFRFMRSDRGYFCLPEIDLGIPFLPGMLEILKTVIPAYKLNEMQFTGTRLTAFDCKDHHIVIDALSREELAGKALEFAKTLKKKRAVVAEFKKRYYHSVLQTMETEDSRYIESGNFHIP
jgi:enoyl-CoA hydratase/carnithine racemase